jgi:hypothetical protein
LQGIVVSHDERYFRRCGWFSILETEEDKNCFWKCGKADRSRAIKEGWETVALYDDAFVPTTTIGDGGYEVANHVPKFMITIQ